MVECTNDSRWVDIPWHPGYQAHPAGVIRSRWIRRSFQPPILGSDWSIVKTHDTSGYKYVYFGSTPLSKLHRVIAELFVPNPERKPLVNHKNGDKADNRAANLEWVTHSENSLHASRVLGYCGERRPKAILSEVNVREIIGLLAEGISPYSISLRYRSKFPVNERTIRSIRDGKNWRHIERPPALQFNTR
jgi:hypothetical protein